MGIFRKTKRDPDDTNKEQAPEPTRSEEEAKRRRRRRRLLGGAYTGGWGGS
ncbi:hypothetical protein JMUB6875_72390 [Nocardia sp. JMUB6875]|uniref:hypothetical protein n=1 Tax=Nocardia sp. JMUB6875 TaxID=3158170 RepID=UPI0032E555FE